MIAAELPTPGPGGGGAKTVSEQIAIVKTSTNIPKRRAAVKSLGDVNETDERNFGVTDVLIDVVVKGNDPMVPAEAVRSLTKIQLNVNKQAKTKYTKPFIEILKKPEAFSTTRSTIAECFRRTLEKEGLNDRDAFKVMLDISANKTEPNLALRSKCIEAIGAFGAADALPVLTTLLIEPDDYIKVAAANALDQLMEKDFQIGAQAAPAAVNKLLEILRDEKADVTLKALSIRVLARMISAGNQFANKGMDDIIKLVQNSDQDKIVLACIDALGFIGTSQAQKPLEKTYADYFPTAMTPPKTDTPRDIGMREAIASAYSNMLSVQAQRPNPDLKVVHDISVLLVKMVDDDPAPTVKSNAVIALAFLYAKKFDAEVKEVTSALIYRLKNTQDPELKTLIAETLEAITRVNFGTDAERWLGWWTKKYGKP